MRRAATSPSPSFDLINGTAGVLRALVLVADATADVVARAELVETAKALGEQLARHATATQPDERWPFPDRFPRDRGKACLGYGHGAEFWKALVSALRLVGYDHVLSIEHEDSLMSVHEGLAKAAQLLKEAVIEEPAGAMWWA